MVFRKTKTEKLKERLKKALEKIKLQGEVIENIIEEMNGKKVVEEEKPLKTNYRTSCIAIEDRKGKLLTEF